MKNGALNKIIPHKGFEGGLILINPIYISTPEITGLNKMTDESALVGSI